MKATATLPPFLHRTSRQVTRRYRSSGGGGGGKQPTTTPYQSAEYPWATVPPVITKTTAAQAAAGQPPSVVPVHVVTTRSSNSIFDMFRSSSSSSTTPAAAEEETEVADEGVAKNETTSKESSKSTSAFSKMSALLQTALGTHNDPFDDQQTLSEEERMRIRRDQFAKARQQTLSPLLEPIRTTPPSYLPKNVVAETSNSTSTSTATDATSGTRITTLSNGIRVVSLASSSSPVATIGCVTQLGSRYETPRTRGATHLWEVLGVPTASDDMECVVAMGREQTLQCTEVWRPQTETAVALLSGMVQDPSAVVHSSLEPALQALHHQCMDVPHDVLLQDAMQHAAFGTDQALGQPHFVTDTATLQQLADPSVVLQHWKDMVTDNPQGIVVGAVGGGNNDKEHDALCRMVDVHLGHLQQTTDLATKSRPSVYRGGRCILDRPLTESLDDDDQSEVAQEKRLSRVALVWPTGGWHATDEFVACCVLQSLWGGGSSFSAGGPGKGMYSRLYRTLLNQYHWVESAEASAVFFDEAGLLGIVGSAPPQAARDLIKLFCHHLLWLANKPVQDEELNRAKSMLRCNVLMQLESRLVSFEDVSRQVLTYGRHEPMSETAHRIEAVTPQHLQDLAIRMLQHPPSLAVVGMDLSPDLPSEEELQEWLRR